MKNKEKSSLITQALVSSIEWAETAPNRVILPARGGDGILTWKGQAQVQLVEMLKRDKAKYSPEAMHGIEFEKKVYDDVAAGGKIKGSDFYKEVCRQVKGYKFGEKEGKQVGERYYYCRYDAIANPRLIDLKTTKKYTRGKYLKTFQHELYCYVSGCTEFEYIVIEWDKFPKIKAVHYESYEPPEERRLEEIVRERSNEALVYLKQHGLYGLYKDHYCLY